MKKVMLFLFIAVCSLANADQATSAYKGESEASSVVVTGNSTTESYNAKSKNTYQFTELDLVTGFGSYLQSRAAGTESNKYWSAGLRYDRVLQKDVFNIFVQRKAEADPYNGYVQRDTNELGLKYTLLKNNDLNWFAELGYQSQDTYTGVADRTVVGFARLYTEAEYKITSTATTKLWVEHLPNLKKSSESQSNAELSLSVALNQTFSLKTAYLLNRDEAIVSPLKKDKTTWTTALVANY